MEGIIYIYIYLAIIFLVVMYYYKHGPRYEEIKEMNKNHDSKKNSFIDTVHKIGDNLGNIIIGIIQGLLSLAFLALLGIGYIANLFALSSHWGLPLTVQYLAELIGVIIFPIGIVTGWLHIFSHV